MSVRCLFGGSAPCVDDLCHGGDTTLCGLWLGFDFCIHENDPEDCPECRGEEDGFDDWPDEDEEAVTR